MLYALLIILFLPQPSSLFAQETIQVIGYLPQRSVKKMTPKHFEMISQAIYFGIDADKKGNIQVDECHEDLIFLNTTRKNTDAGISLCFGGWERSDFFKKMTASKKYRANFCRQVLDICQKYDLNGVDIDWEYPKTKKQRKNFKKLIIDLYETLHPHDLDISIAVGHWQTKIDLTASVEPWLSYVNIMLYDNADSINGHASFKLVEKATQDFMKAGIPANKIMVGVPFYGRHRINRLKTMAYNQVPDPEKNISPDGWHEGYFFNPPSILKEKIDLINKKGFGGIMIWELGHDLDPGSKHSLLKAIHENIN
jgi:GH18 family chitinase